MVVFLGFTRESFFLSENKTMSIQSVCRFLLTLVVVVFVLLPDGLSAGKTCNFKELDMCFTNFYYDQKGLPTNERQLRKACSSTKNLIKW